MARLFGLAEHTLFVELIERSMDAMFDEQCGEWHDDQGQTIQRPTRLMATSG